MELFTKLVDEMAAAGWTQIDFNVVIGDPLLDKRLLERARYVNRHPQFQTNGFVTTLQWLHLHDIDEFFDCGFTWLAVSTTLSGRETYMEFFGVDKYDQMLSNLKLLLTENNKRGNPLTIRVRTNPTDEPTEQVLTHPDYQDIKQLLSSGDVMDDRRGFYVGDWSGVVELPTYLKKRPVFPRGKRPCKLLYDKLMVYSNGNVGACSCRDHEATSELILGNIAHDSICDLWNGQELSSIRDNWLENNEIPEICRSCRSYVY